MAETLDLPVDFAGDDLPLRVQIKVMPALVPGRIGQTRQVLAEIDAIRWTSRDPAQ